MTNNFFFIQIRATEINFSDRETTKTFQVKLKNWNDELPHFEQEEYIFRVLETVSAGESIGFVLALDEDIGDTLE